MNAHFLERPLSPELKSRCILSRKPAGKAIIFVHGYGGNAITTWSRFDSLLADRASCSGHDLIFYGYDGLHSDTVSSASLFLELLEVLFTNPLSLINEVLPSSAQRSSDFNYCEILIAAHSLGAVIARWALLMAHEEGRDWPQRIKLVLFAPAHRGANVTKIALEAMSGFKAMQILAGFVRFRSPLIDQLAEGSTYLQELLDRVNRLVGESGDHCLLARAVFVAEREHVVANLPFSRDPYPIPVAGSDHFSICKPERNSDRTVQKICELL
jgi:pimeloyl-ACP methyl ester carboxylesterase